MTDAVPAPVADSIALGVEHRDFLARTTVADIAGPMPEFVASGPVMLRQIAYDASLCELVEQLDQTPMMAVVDGRQVVGVVDRTCCDRLPFRCWLFGLITLLEDRIRNNLAHAEQWRDALSPDRLAKARELKAERQRRGQQADTLSSLQFGDLAMANTRIDRQGWWAGVTSRRAQKRVFRQLELLRNDLAHSQCISDSNWPAVVTISQQYATLTHTQPPA